MDAGALAECEADGWVCVYACVAVCIWVFAAMDL